MAAFAAVNELGMYHEIHGDGSLPLPLARAPPLANPDHFGGENGRHHLPHVDLPRRLRRRA